MVISSSEITLLNQDFRHPSLHLKKIGQLWSMRIGIHYRAFAVEENGEVAWFWIGFHAEYDRIFNLDYSPACETLSGMALQKIDCFVDKSPKPCPSKGFEDFRRSS